MSEGLLAEAVDRRDERGDEGEQPAGEGEQAADGRGARAVLGAHAPPARDVGRRRQADERQGARVERPRSVRSHCAGLSQSRGRGVTRRPPASAVLAAARHLLAALRRSLRSPLPRAGPAARRSRPASRCAGPAGASCASCAGRAARAAACRCRARGAARRRARRWSRAWAPVAFEGPARALVHALKFRGALGVADAMAAQIVAGAPPGLLAAPAALVPVPTHPLRRRVRGFDHAGWLAAAIGGAHRPAGGALPGPRGSADAPGRIVARGPPGAGPHRRSGARRSTFPRRVGRRCAHHGRDARGMRFGAATSGGLRGVCGRLCTGVEMT